MAFAEVNDIRLHYWQTGEGPDMVMIHGLTGNLAIWHFTVLSHFRHQYRTTMYDLRGHGRSEMPPTGYTTKDMAADLLGLLDSLGIEKAHLIGHSLGADIALHFAMLHPDRVDRIVAMEAGTAALVHLRKNKDWAGWEEWARAIEAYGGVKVPREKWHDVNYMLRQTLQVPIVFGPARGLPRKGDQLIRLLETTTLIEEYQDASGMTLEAMSAIQHPILLLYGRDSTYMGTYETLRDILPNATTVLLEGGGHFRMFEDPETLSEHIRTFLASDPVQEKGLSWRKAS